MAILEADHRALLQRLERIHSFRHPLERQWEWRALNEAIRRHMAVEEEVFYPAFFDATEDSLTHFLASVGHEKIAAEMQDVLEVSAGSASFVSRVRAIKKVFMHHVSDMEEEGGMFDRARRSTMQHELLARLVRARYAALEAAAGQGEYHRRRTAAHLGNDLGCKAIHRGSPSSPSVEGMNPKSNGNAIPSGKAAENSKQSQSES
jgi:hypothetical protein